MAEEVRLELTRPLLNPRFSRPLPLDRLGLLFQNYGAGIGTRNRVNSLEGCVAASAYPQTDFSICQTFYKLVAEAGLEPATSSL